MERLNLQARVARELPQLEKEFLKVSKLYSLAITFEIHVEPEEMALYQTLMPSFHNLKVCCFVYVCEKSPSQLLYPIETLEL